MEQVSFKRWAWVLATFCLILASLPCIGVAGDKLPHQKKEVQHYPIVGVRSLTRLPFNGNLIQGRVFLLGPPFLSYSYVLNGKFSTILPGEVGPTTNVQFLRREVAQAIYGTSGSKGTFVITHQKEGSSSSGSARKKALWIIDGQAVQLESALNAQNVESVQFVKPRISSAIYGESAAGGAFVITTGVGSKSEE